MYIEVKHLIVIGILDRVYKRGGELKRCEAGEETEINDIFAQVKCSTWIREGLRASNKCTR